MSRGSGRNPRVFLHIGPPKTGTTYVQSLLRAWQPELRRAGVLYPGIPMLNHFYAALDARGNLGHAIRVGEHDVERTAAIGAWTRLVTAAKAADGTVVISHEVFASADDEHARAAIRDLDDTDLHLIVTARDPARQIVSAWQQRVRQGSTKSFAVVARRVSERQGLPPGQDVPELLERWGGTLPPDHVHVVTVPQAGGDPATLWHRFAEVVGINPVQFDTSRADRSNESLGWAEVETLRRVNVALGGRIAHPQRGEVVLHHFAGEVLADIKTSPRATLPESLGPLADDIAEGWISAIKARGYHVVGDLDDLRPRALGEDRSSRPTDSAVAEVAVRATAELLIELATSSGQSRRVGPVALLKRAAAPITRRLRHAP